MPSGRYVPASRHGRCCAHLPGCGRRLPDCWIMSRVSSAGDFVAAAVVTAGRVGGGPQVLYSGRPPKRGAFPGPRPVSSASAPAPTTARSCTLQGVGSGPNRTATARVGIRRLVHFVQPKANCSRPSPAGVTPRCQAVAGGRPQRQHRRPSWRGARLQHVVQGPACAPPQHVHERCRGHAAVHVEAWPQRPRASIEAIRLWCLLRRGRRPGRT